MRKVHRVDSSNVKTRMSAIGTDSMAVLSISDQRLRSLLTKPAGSLLIHEIYRSLQGEGTFAGLPCVFIRLTACHLRCVYCDSAHSFHSGDAISIDEIVEKTLGYRNSLVEITGGEPLLQPEVFPLMTRLCDAGLTVLLETSGALDIQPVDPRVRIILDIKTPGSGEASANLWSNLDHLKPSDEVKFVITDRDDFSWSVDVVAKYELTRRCPVLVSPAHDRVEPIDLAAWLLESGMEARLQIQLHKILWGPKTRGV